MGPELAGVFAMEKGFSAASHRSREIFAFVATIDTAGQQRLREHLNAIDLEQVGVFEASGCTVFEDRMRYVGRYVSGTVFQVGHGASKDILPRVIYDPNMDYPEGWQ